MLAALVASTGVARADDDDDADEDTEDGAFVPMPKRSIGISLLGHGTRINGKSESGFGPALEFALGRGRWQYFVEAGFASVSMSTWTTSALDMDVTGRMARGGLGARWLARQFRPDESGGIELYLMSMVGIQRFYMDNAMRLSRPELSFGFGMQPRIYKKVKLAVRLDARVLFTPDGSNSSTGFLGGIGVGW